MKTLNDYIAVIQSIELRGGLKRLNAELHIARADERDGTLQLSVYLTVPHVETGAPIVIESSETYRVEELNDSKMPFVERVYNLVKGIWLHEMKESFFVNGAQLAMPHPEQRPRLADRQVML